MQKRQVLIFIVCLALLTAFYSRVVTTVTAQNQIDVVFKTPEEAITFYLEGVAQGDVQKSLQACAINEMSENFKFDLYIERVQAFSPFQTLAPSNSPFYVELNKAQLSSQISNQLKVFAFSLLSSEPVSDGKIIRMDIEKATSFMQDVDPKRLAQIEVKKIDLPNKIHMNSAKYLEATAKIASTYGADESTERAVLFSFEQNYYYIGFTLLRYGENWKISSQNSVMANTNALGVPVKTTLEAFESMINGS
jgi:hypothetical protein